ncbi:TPA: ATP-binding protein [Yersinia enterocolitica]|uniref:ATP-binding protein n=1 Tax=Yersinia enterocolitica TaxID=630 RepID=UPI00227A9210|nr:ATP-binding protein [Yersinia enterocolitica]MCY1685342.1 ATP-binding protein [Yersinia enterocolitica]HEN3251579.1 ATP-binding protein [Yersinia enterocolitica]
MSCFNFKELSAIGYVVGLEGDRIRVNLHEGLQGRLASHRDGISSVTQPGDLIGFDSGNILVIARVTDMAFLEPDKAHKANIGTQNIVDMPLRQVIAYAIGFIQRIGGKYTFTSEDWRLPALGASAVPLSNEFLNIIYSIDDEDLKNAVELGLDSRTRSVRINVSIDKLLSRHVAVLGSTGYGKSNFNALLTQQISKKYPESRIVIFDINGEYAQAFVGLPNVKHTILGEPPTLEQQLVPPQLKNEAYSEDYFNYKKIPYQALGFAGLIKMLRPSDKTQLPSLRSALEAINRTHYRGPNVFLKKQNNEEFNIFNDCREESQSELGSWLDLLRRKQLVRTDRWPPFKALSNLVAEFGCVASNGNRGGSKRDAFSYGNVLPLVKIIQQLSEDNRFKNIVDIKGGQDLIADGKHWDKVMNDEVDYFFGKEKGIENGWNVHIVNLRNLSQDHAPMILSALLEMFAEVLFKRGQQKSFPTVLLLEEAHHYLRDPFSEVDAQVKAYERLAKEGRKFKCSLIVSTQRPSELSSTVLAMCANWVALRLTSERDILALRHAMENGNEHTLRQISGLPRGDAVAFGSAFNLPIRLSIHEAKPGTKSSDANFSGEWQGTV